MVPYRWLTLVADRNAISEVLDPVFPPDRNASDAVNSPREHTP